MGDIGAVYEVTSFLLDPPAYTHKLAHYGEKVSAALQAAIPGLTSKATSEDWERVRVAALAKYGETLDLPNALRGVQADDKDPIETLRAMGFTGEIIILRTIRPGSD